MPAFRLSAAAPRSEAALSLKPFVSSASVSPSASSHRRIISIGVSVQPISAAWMAAERAAFSSGVSFGRPKAALTRRKASVSRSITSRSRARSACSRSSTSAAKGAKSAYFFFERVRQPTIAVSAAPSAPESAADEPPPGAGASEASSSAKAETVISESFISAPPYSLRSIRWYSMTCLWQSKFSSLR